MFRTGRLVALRGLAALLAAALLFALLAVGCDGGDGEGETPQTDETPAADGAGDEGLQDLESLAAKAAGGVVAKVTYKYTTDVGGKVTEGEWLVVQRPPDSRFELSGTEGGEEFRNITITSGGKSYACFSGGGEERCFGAVADETEPETEAVDPLFDVPREIAEAAADVDLVDKSERQIAGMDATCFEIGSGVADLGQGEVCFSDQGIVLLMRGEPAFGSFSLEAISASTDVTDADFEPPYDVTELLASPTPTP